MITLSNNGGDRKILLVEPNYYTRYPPLGLLKLANYHRSRGDLVKFVRGEKDLRYRNYDKPFRGAPDKIYVTSLFSYSWRPVHDAVKYYKRRYPSSELYLGGIYASLLPEHAATSGADEIHVGLHNEAEAYAPAWDLIPEWDSSILFASRGCVRKCGFCSVPKLEGPVHDPQSGLRKHISPNHKSIILWDNNFLGVPTWKSIIDELVEIGLPVDFNQGLDARLLTEEVAHELRRLKIPRLRLAYDYTGVGPFLKKALERLQDAGFSRRSVVVYTLFNYIDSPDDFMTRLRELTSWGAVSYPMRFEPLTSLKKNKYVSPKWSLERLEAVAKFRRVLGYAGALPPYEGLIKKLNSHEEFDEVFSLRKKDPKKKSKITRRKNPRFGGDLDWRATASA